MDSAAMVSQLQIEGLSSGLAAVCEGLLLASGILAGGELRGSPAPLLTGKAHQGRTKENEG